MKTTVNWPVIALGALAVGLFAGLWLTFLHPASPLLRKAVNRDTEERLVRLVVAIERFRDSAGHYPGTLQLLHQATAPPRAFDVLDLSRGHGTPSLLQFELAADGRSYDLFAVGLDGKPGTADDIRPPIPPSLAGYTGFVAGK
jgi:hypothetical protein